MTLEFKKFYLIVFGLFLNSPLWSQEETFIPPKDIRFNHKGNLVLKNTTDSTLLDAALFALFPAPMPENGLGYEDWKTPAYWTCNTCVKQSFPDYNNSEDSSVPTITFPFEFNYTVPAGELNFEKNKINYKLLSYSTAESNDGTGRFVSGVLCLALVECTKTSKKIIAFNPAVNYQGSFTNADPPSRVYETPQAVFFLGKGGIANGVSVEDYWPIYSDLFVYNEALKQVFRLRHAYCDLNCEKGSNWSTDLLDIQQNDTEIILTTQTLGILVKDAFWDAPEALYQLNINKRVIEDETIQFKIVTQLVLGQEGLITETNEIELVTAQKSSEKFTISKTYKHTL